MKKIAFPALVLIMALSAVSCKREYTCLCKEHEYLNNQYRNETTRVEEVKARNVSQASKSCIAKNSEALDEHGSGHKTICDVVR